MSHSSAALHAAEAITRPEPPLEGFRILTRPGEEWPVVTDPTGRLLYAPECRIQRAAAAPDGSLLALEVADDGSEAGRLVLLDAAGQAYDVATGPLRYADLAWARTDASLRLHLLDAERRWLEVDPETRTCRELAGPSPERRWLVTLGGAVTTLDHSPANSLLTLPVPRAVVRGGEFTLLIGAADLVLLDGDGEWDGDGEVDAPRVRATRAWDAEADGSIVHAITCPNGLVLHVSRAGRSRLIRLDRDLIVRADLGPLDAVTAISGLSWAEGEVWVRIESPALPPRVVGIDDIAALPEAATPRSALITVDAEDGTPIEVVLTGETDRPRPLLLEVYGGFGLVEQPTYEPSVAAWCALGGLHATARIRGGGGTGSAWHEAARGPRKNRAVLDTVAVIRGLVAASLTRQKLITIAGASHGGLIAAAAALHEPELVAAVACTAAPLDPHRLAEHPLAAAWAEEFGSVEDEAVRAAMDEYSPLRRLERFPAHDPLPRFLLTTFAEDARIDRHATDRFEAALRTRGACVVRRHRPAMGHGRNSRSSVHDFAASVLDFALASTRDTRGPA